MPLLAMAISVRKAALQDAAAVALIRVDTWPTTYRGIMPDEFLSNLSYERRQHMWEDALDDPSDRTTVFATMVTDPSPRGPGGFPINIRTKPLPRRRDSGPGLFAHP